MNKSTLINKSLEIANKLNLPTNGLENEMNNSLDFWRIIYNKLKQEENKRTPNYKKLIQNKEYNKVLSKLQKTNITLTEEQAEAFLDKLSGDRYVITINNKSIPLHNNNKFILYKLLTEGFLLEIINEFGNYNKNANYSFEEINKIKINKLTKPTKIMKNKNGAFFPYVNTSDIDLTDYQIYKDSDEIDEENCLIYSLLKYDIRYSLINNIKLTFKQGSSIKKTDIKEIAKIIDKRITLYQYDNRDKLIKTQFNKGNETLENIDIAIYENHYFKYEMTNHKKKGRTTKTLTSLALVKYLFQEGYFKKLDMSKFINSTTHKDLKNHVYLDNIDKEQREIEVKQKPNLNASIFYADTETFVSGNTHKLYLLGVANENNDLVNIYSCEDDKYKIADNKRQTLIYDFLNDITNYGRINNCIVYFHNLKYDYNIIESYINITSKCVKDNQIYSVTLTHRKCSIELRDSYKVIPQALKKFNKMFNLPEKFNKQEAIAYKYYNKHNHNKIIKTKEYKKLLCNDDKIIFDKIIKDEFSYNKKNKTFNPTDYYKKYLKYDVLVLKYGLNKFNLLLSEITKKKINMYNYLTISSIADHYFKLLGCYDEVYENTGNLRNYISKAVYGGRVSTNKKYEKQIITEKVSDYDACSLYPSAIYRICKEETFEKSFAKGVKGDKSPTFEKSFAKGVKGDKSPKGFPTGKAVRYDKNELNDWNKKIYSILTIKINKVNKNQQIPFIAFKDDDNILQYTNEPIDKEIVVDSTTLEDYINFHEIEYDLIDGVYWNEGVNKKFGEEIEKLYNERLKYKKSNPAMAEVIKLMLNSAYGKTIMKQSNTKTNIMKYNEEKINNYIYNHFDIIKNYRQINKDCYEFEVSCLDSTYNRGQIGCSILSMSKRIMNEVFDVANNNDIPIYYTDTDSMHLNLNDVNKLEQLYNKKYNRELNGKQLTQFHTDFSLDGACSEIYSYQSLFLGKKCYIDCLESTDKSGNIIKGHHIRLKGITEAGIDYTAKQYGGYFEMFKVLAKGDAVNFLLNPYDDETGKEKVLFEYTKEGVRTKQAFYREVKF
jgi:hypothetical protein